jgi:hypothetical protein
MRIPTIAPLIVASMALSLTACKKKGQETTNAEFAEMYDQHNYDDMETTEEYNTYEDQGASISPREMEAIQQTIEEYAGDFEHCLETEMDRLDNRWVAGPFAVEFHISSKSGKVTEVTVTEVDVKERRTKNAEGEYVSEGGAAPRVADGYAQCVHDKLMDWEFDPAPNTDYVHTYTGEIGEAW